MITMSGRSTTTRSSGTTSYTRWEYVGASTSSLPDLMSIDEAQQRPAVVGLREALALQQPAALELGVGVEEAVGGDQRDVGVLGPVRQHLLQHARGRRLADRDRAGEPDHERRARRLRLVQELLLLAVQAAGGLDVQAEQPREREVDLLHLVEVELRRRGRAAA